MIDDFNRKNERTYALEDKFPKDQSSLSGTGYPIVDLGGKRDKSFGPYDIRSTSVSRVGFSKDRKKALVYVVYVATPRSGGGYYVFLDKAGGKWVIDESVMIEIF